MHQKLGGEGRGREGGVRKGGGREGGRREEDGIQCTNKSDLPQDIITG